MVEQAQTLGRHKRRSRSTGDIVVKQQRRTSKRRACSVAQGIRKGDLWDVLTWKDNGSARSLGKGTRNVGRRRSGLRKKGPWLFTSKGAQVCGGNRGVYSGTRSAMTPRRRRYVCRSGEGKCKHVAVLMPLRRELKFSSVGACIRGAVVFWSVGRIRSLSAVETVETLEIISNAACGMCSTVVVAGVNTSCITQPGKQPALLDQCYVRCIARILHRPTPSGRSAGDVEEACLGRHKCLDFPCLRCNGWVHRENAAAMQIKHEYSASLSFHAVSHAISIEKQQSRNTAGRA